MEAPVVAPRVLARPGWPTRSRSKVAGLHPGERRMAQALVDWLLVVGIAVVIGLNSARHYSPFEMWASGLVFTALWVFFASAFDAYRVGPLQSVLRSPYVAIKVFLAGGVSYLLFAAFTGGFLPVIRPRISETAMECLALLPLVVSRYLFARLLNQNALRRRVVVVGANDSGVEMVNAIRGYGGRVFQFLGYFDDIAPAAARAAGITGLVSPVAELVHTCADLGIDQIVLANPDPTPELQADLAVCHERGIQVTPMFALYQDLTGRVPVAHLGPDWFVALPAHVKSTARTYRMIKRLLDVGFALVLLLPVLPLVPLIVLAIKLDSPGPVFFRQVRMGRGARPFTILKFRSMRQDAEAATGAVWAQNGDKRITRVGRLLRKTRLDEIPQLWNVVVGEMSFIGPRPERPEFDAQLQQAIPFYRARRAIPPGLTGWAQVRYGYGNTLEDALHKVEYDLYYIKNESPYLDLMILLRTISVILRGSGT
jgi:exopolysaccharide biosynthesis polyprenyl glycosylphosphotransferase